jgi:hypothetical protein
MTKSDAHGFEVEKFMLGTTETLPCAIKSTIKAPSDGSNLATSIQIFVSNIHPRKKGRAKTV